MRPVSRSTIGWKKIDSSSFWIAMPELGLDLAAADQVAGHRGVEEAELLLGR
jgi:hypothetical protein